MKYYIFILILFFTNCNQNKVADNVPNQDSLYRVLKERMDMMDKGIPLKSTPAPEGAFEVTPDGRILVADASLISADLSPYELKVVVTDDGNPPMTDTAVMTIDVSRAMGPLLCDTLEFYQIDSTLVVDRIDTIFKYEYDSTKYILTPNCVYDTIKEN